MPKDTKSSGNNKAPACESRGFGHKKEGENFDTPSKRQCFVSYPFFNTSSLSGALGSGVDSGLKGLK